MPGSAAAMDIATTGYEYYNSDGRDDGRDLKGSVGDFRDHAKDAFWEGRGRDETAAIQDEIRNSMGSYAAEGLGYAGLASKGAALVGAIGSVFDDEIANMGYQR